MSFLRLTPSLVGYRVPVIGSPDPLYASVVHLIQMGADNESPITDKKGTTITSFGDTSLVSGSGYFTGSNHALFDGSGDYLEWTGPTGSLDNDFSIEFAIYPLTLVADHELFVIGSGTSVNLLLELAINNDIRFSLRNDFNASFFDFNSSANSVTLNSWNFIQAIVSGSIATIAINGVSSASSAITSQSKTFSFTRNRIGYLHSGAPREYHGRYTSFRFTTAARAIGVPSEPFSSF